MVMYKEISDHEDKDNGFIANVCEGSNCWVCADWESGSEGYHFEWRRNGWQMKWYAREENTQLESISQVLCAAMVMYKKMNKSDHKDKDNSLIANVWQKIVGCAQVGKVGMRVITRSGGK